MGARSGRRPGFLGVSPVKSLIRQFEPACLDQGRNGLWRGSLHVQPVFSPFHNMARIVPSWSLDEGIVRRFVRYRTNIKQQGACQLADNALASTKSCGSLMGCAVAHAFSKSVNVRLVERLSWPRSA